MQPLFKQLYWTRSKATKVLNGVLIFLLMLSLTPIAAQAASVRQQPGALCEPTKAATRTIFLPLISSAGQVVSSLHNLVDAPASAPRQLHYEVGKTYQYEYQVTVNATSAKRDSQGVRKDGSETTVIYALADLTITGQDANGVYSGQIALRDPFLCRTDGTTAQQVTEGELLDAVKIPLLFKQAANGAITEVSVPASASAQAINIQKGVLNALQVTLKESENSYSVQEETGQGAVQAAYTLAEQDADLHITRRFNRDSFTNLILRGAEAQSLQLQNQIDLVLDGDQGVISSVQYSEEIASSDGEADLDNTGKGFDGVTAWSEVKSEGKLTLKSVTVADVVTAAALAGPYQVDSLGAELGEEYPNQRGIDLTQVDLNSELARLESEPNNPEHHARILALVEADDDNPAGTIDVLGKIAERLQANAGNLAVASAYVDVLGSVGTPRAQEILSNLLNNAQVSAAVATVAFSDTTKEQALFNISLLSSPTVTTVNTIKTLALSQDATLQETATTVLGATAGQLLDKDPAAAAELADLLVDQLATANSSSEVELYLNALGNAGLPATLGTITSYLTATAPVSGTTEVTDALDVQAAALVALRKIPGDEVEGLLLGALGNDDKPDNLRFLVAGLLNERPALSEAGLAALETFPQQSLNTPGKYSLNWSRRLGNTNLGVDFPGGIEVNYPPAVNGINAYGYQKADALVYGNVFNVVKGELRVSQSGNNYVFGAYLFLANNLITKKELLLPCADDKGGNLFSGTRQFLDVTFSIPIFAVITLNINITASGSFTLDWNFRIDVCPLSALTVQAGIVPKAWATASASAYLDIVVARGGASLNATLLNTQVPVQASLSVNAAATPITARFCIDIRATTQPLSGSLTAWADIRVPRWGWPPYEWKRVGQGTLWTFSVPTSSYNLLVQCF